MVSIIKRMRKLKTLLNLRVGPGAAVLPENIKKISMQFPNTVFAGNRGAKRFMRDILPRLKYRNPAVPMTVNRFGLAQDAPATMTVWFRPEDRIPPNPEIPHKLFKGEFRPTTPQPSEIKFTTPPPPESSPNVTKTPSGAFTKVTIDMKHKEESMILDELVRLTQAKAIEPTETELEEMRDLEEQKARSKIDSEMMKKLRAQQKREAEMMAQARGELGLAG